MPDLPVAQSPLPAQAIHAHFATRPALFSVVFKALRAGIREHYPSLKVDLLTLKLAGPTPCGANTCYAFPLLINVAMAHALNPRLLDLRLQNGLPYYLSPISGGRLADIDMQVIAHIIDELPGSLYLHFQADLAAYWSETDSLGSSRWQWLGEWLNGQMTAAAAGRQGLSDTHRDMLATTAAWPSRVERLPRSTPTTYAYFIETTLSKAGKEVCLLTPDLLLVRDRQVLLCSVAGVVEPFGSLDAFGEAWGARMQAQFQFDSLTWRRNEPDGNVFEQQAGLILNQQLEDLEALDYQGQSEAALDRTLETLTDPALLFTQTAVPAPAHLQKVDEKLPAWLKQATANERFAYHRHLQDMAQVLRLNQGRSFNEGVENIHVFSRNALRKQMQADHADHDPDDVLLDFAVAAGYPGGAGIIEHVQLSLTELAVKNLAGKPKGTLTLRSKTAGALPGWLSEDYLLGSQGLIQRVDIGTAYPQKIKDLLLSDTADARRREKLFTRELKVQLPMRALEYAIRQQHGVTATGYRYVKALMGETPADRVVDAQEIVLRPLALCRKAGATPDAVSNFFVIEPRDATVGPHVLYRPLYAEALFQYPTRQALLEALASPGELQSSVLTWLSDTARPIYDNGGIKQPHIIRFLPGDEFAPPEDPAPATLAVDEGAEEWLQSQINGQLLSHLFGSTARAMVDLADRESVSNHESRWAIVMEGAWLLFNTLLLPLVRGPAMLAGWFLVMVSSLEQDLAGLDSSDPTTRELALIDLLLNTAMLLLHATSASPRSRQPLARPAPEENVLRLATWRHPAGRPPQPGQSLIRHGAVTLPGEPPATGRTALDFSRSLASPQASAKLLKALLDVHVPWPETLPPPEASGPLMGLYRIGQTWHASVGGLLFQVSVVPGFGEVYLVDPQRPLHPGFKLVSDNQGHWRLERKARLEGGMPKKKLEEQLRIQRERIDALKRDLSALEGRFVPVAIKSIELKVALDDARNRLAKERIDLRADWSRLANTAAIPALHVRMTQRHEQRRLSTAQAKVDWEIAVERYLKQGHESVSMLQQMVTLAGELVAADRTDPNHVKRRNSNTRALFNYWGAVYEVMSQKLLDTLQTERGETEDEVHDRVNTQLPNGITDAYEEFRHIRKQQFDVLKQKIEPAQHVENILQQADPALRQLLLQDSPSDQNISSSTLNQHALIFLTELVFDRTHPSRELAEFPYIMVLTDAKTVTSVLAHTEMRSTRGYSTLEQIDVLKDVLERYDRLENAVRSLAEMGSGFVREEYRATFLDEIGSARTDLEAELADLILSEEGFAHRPRLPAPAREKPATRRVIRTRNQRTLVGDLRAPQPDMPGNFVDITDPHTKKIVASYHEHAAEGVWAEVVQAAPVVSPSAPVKRSLNTIKRSAESVFAERARIERTIRDQQRKLGDPTRRETLRPVEWEDMLTQHASKIEALANEIKKDHATHAEADDLIKAYGDRARAARNLAHEVRAQGYMQQLPKAENIDYLHKKGFIDINLVKSRKLLAAGDFLTEYSVKDKQTLKVLWYAHFHYPTELTPAAQHSFAHLKLPEQQSLTRRQVIEQAAADNRTAVLMDKALIRPPLDQKLFLILEPPLQA